MTIHEPETKTTVMIIVTGANGFIGSQFILALNQAGRTDILAVDPVDLKERPEPLQNAKYQQLLGKNELFDFLKTPVAHQVDWIVHIGANSSTTEKSWDHLLENNVQYSEKLFSWCADKRKPLIYASSAATYGAGELGYDDATDSEKLQPLNLYGRSKVEMDRWAIKQKAHPTHWYGLKYFNVYGPHEEHKGEQASVALKAFHQIGKDGKLKLFKSYKSEYKDGEQKRDFVYVKDICGWMLELMEKKPTSGLYNMGSGQARSWLDLAHAVFAAMGRKPNIEFIDMPGDLKDQYQYFTEAKMAKWKNQKMSNSKYSLEAGVKDYVQGYLQR